MLSMVQQTTSRKLLVIHADRELLARDSLSSSVLPKYHVLSPGPHRKQVLNACPLPFNGCA